MRIKWSTFARGFLISLVVTMLNYISEELGDVSTAFEIIGLFTYVIVTSYSVGVFSDYLSDLLEN